MSDKTEQRQPSQLTLDWIDQSALNAIQMSENEDFRQLVASRATNWGKGIQARVEQKIRRSQAPHLVIDDPSHNDQ